MRRQKNILSKALTVPAPGGPGIGPQLLARGTGILQPPQPFEAALLLVMPHHRRSLLPHRSRAAETPRKMRQFRGHIGCGIPKGAKRGACALTSAKMHGQPGAERAHERYKVCIFLIQAQTVQVPPPMPMDHLAHPFKLPLAHVQTDAHLALGQVQHKGLAPRFALPLGERLKPHAGRIARQPQKVFQSGAGYAQGSLEAIFF